MLTLRRAELRDWARLLYWRNDPATRAMSKTGKAIALDEHTQWLKDALVNKDIILLIARDTAASRYVGMCRIDRCSRPREGSSGDEETYGEVSIVVDPRCRGIGYGDQIIQAAVRMTREQMLRMAGRLSATDLLTTLVASVKADNWPSLRAFTECGFVLKVGVAGAKILILECSL